MIAFAMMAIVCFVLLMFLLSFVFFARKYGARLGQKIGSTLAGYFLAGLIGSVLLFTLILSEEIFWYAHYRYTCATETMDEVYDKSIREEFERQYREGKVKDLTEKEFDYYKKKYPMIEKEASTANIDENNVIYYAIMIRGIGEFRSIYKMIDLNTNKLVYEQRDYAENAGGISSLINIVGSGPLKYGFCSSNKHGAFSDK
ncbi:MAG: hypothetical protein LBU87_01635 [Lactobacillales bacterium]|jgi:hypothetical protein|nr:hypothetical protein [Lactobacillales bacterium]